LFKRRILRSIAAKNDTDLGDTTTLADPTVVDALIAKRKTLCPAQPRLPSSAVPPHRWADRGNSGLIFTLTLLWVMKFS
jgi:hypothetical protein